MSRSAEAHSQTLFSILRRCQNIGIEQSFLGSLKRYQYFLFWAIREINEDQFSRHFMQFSPIIILKKIKIFVLREWNLKKHNKYYHLKKI